MARIADLIEQYLKSKRVLGGIRLVNDEQAHEMAEDLERLVQGSFVVLPDKLGGKRDG